MEDVEPYAEQEAEISAERYEELLSIEKMNRLYRTEGLELLRAWILEKHPENGEMTVENALKICSAAELAEFLENVWSPEHGTNWEPRARELIRNLARRLTAEEEKAELQAGYRAEEASVDG